MHVLLKMDESTYAEDDGSDGVDDDHPISWCQRYDGGRSFYTGLGHTQASFAEAGILSHIAAGIEIAAGVLPVAACGVAPGANADPVISAVTATPASGVAPLAVTFAATATDADGDALTYTWDLNGDGTFETTGAEPVLHVHDGGCVHAGGEGHGRTRRLGDAHARPRSASHRRRAPAPTCRCRWAAPCRACCR